MGWIYIELKMGRYLLVGTIDADDMVTIHTNEKLQTGDTVYITPDNQGDFCASLQDSKTYILKEKDFRIGEP